MKRCPECNRTYSDETLNFCLEDGASLVNGGAADEVTAIFSPAEQPTETYTKHQSDFAAGFGATAQPWSLGPALRFPFRKLIWVVVPIALLLGGFLVYRYVPASGEKQIESIAIMPFVNASNNPDTEYLSDGISESLINSLSQVPNLRVVPRSTVFRYKGRDIDPQTVGQDLGVRAVLTGRLVQRGDTLSIQTELVDVTEQSTLWGEQYNRKLADLLAVQEEISREISSKLRLKLSGEERKQLDKQYTENTEAYHLYLKGRYYWNKRTRDGYKKGIEYFEQAIEKDPSYALAYTGLADSYTLLNRFGAVPPREIMPKAKAAATKALEIDDTRAEAHSSMAIVRWQYDWDSLGAERDYTQAIKLNPNYATARHWYALYLAESGRLDEAIAEIKRAQDLDPLSLIISTDAGHILYLARRYTEAIEQCGKTLEMDPNFFRAHLWLGRAYERKGMYGEAIAALQNARRLDDAPVILALLGHAYAVAGRKGEAQQVLDELKELSKRNYVDSYLIATIHTALENKDEAFKELEKAYEDRSCWMGRLKVEPDLDGLRSDPRFADLVRRVGLSP